MAAKVGVGLLGLGTVGGGVASILQNPSERHPLVGELELIRVAVRDLNRPRPVALDESLLTTDPSAVIQDPAVDVVVEVIGGLEPARSLILQAIAAGKSVVTANKAVIARHGQEIAEAAAAAGVYVLIEAAVGGGIPIIEPLKQSLGGNRINRVSGIINGTTNYILTRMAEEGPPMTRCSRMPRSWATPKPIRQRMWTVLMRPTRSRSLRPWPSAAAWIALPFPPTASVACRAWMWITPINWATA